MNQRQKKKTSQQRKRYFDGVKAREAHSSGAQKKQSSRDHQSKPHPPATEQLLSNKVHGGPSLSKEKDSDVLTQDQRKTFSKRKIVSNWAKYDEERIEDLDSTSQQQESEEALQDRLLQLFNLPLTHTTPSLADIGGEENSVSVATQQQSRESSKFLTLDCIALAEALSSLPLHERLDIDPKLLLEADTGEAGIGSQSDIDPFELTSASFHTTTSKGVVSLRDVGKANVLDLTSTLKRITVANGTTNEERTIDFSSLKASTQASSFSRQLPGFSGTKLLPPPVDEEAEKLDKLLNRSESKPRHGKSSHSHQQSEEEENRSTRTDRAVNFYPPSTVTAAVNNETSELDDMLDELLA